MGDVIVCVAQTSETLERKEGSSSATRDVPPGAWGPPAAVPHVPVLCSSLVALASNPIHGQKPTSAGLVLAGVAHPLGQTWAMASIGAEQPFSVVPATAGPAWLQVI